MLILCTYKFVHSGFYCFLALLFKYKLFFLVEPLASMSCCLVSKCFIPQREIPPTRNFTYLQGQGGLFPLAEEGVDSLQILASQGRAGRGTTGHTPNACWLRND